jgi:hypothetical protein
MLIIKRMRNGRAAEEHKYYGLWLVYFYHFRLNIKQVSSYGRTSELVTSLMTRTEMVLEILVYSPVKHLMWLLA